MYEVTIPEVFTELKSIPFLKHAVIAGGYLRNQVIGMQPEDLDIFVPCTGLNSFAEKAWEELPKISGMTISDQRASDYDTISMMKYDISYKGFDIDLMGVRINVDGFSNNLIETFPFGNQQIYHDGKKLFTSTYFDEDIQNHTMSLKNCRSLQDMIIQMKKYDKLSEMYRTKLGLRLKFASDYILTKSKGDDWL